LVRGGPPRKEDSDVAHLRLRMTASLRASLDAASVKNGRTLTAEINHRLEQFERIERAYAVATTDGFSQRLMLQLVEVAEEVGRRFDPSTHVVTDAEGNTLEPEVARQFFISRGVEVFASQWPETLHRIAFADPDYPLHLIAAAEVSKRYVPVKKQLEATRAKIARYQSQSGNETALAYHQKHEAALLEMSADEDSPETNPKSRATKGKK